MLHAIKKWHDQIDTGAEDLLQASQPFDHVFFGLRNNAHAQENKDDDQRRQRQNHDIATRQLLNIHASSPLITG